MAERVLGGVSVRRLGFLLCSFSCVVYRQPRTAHCRIEGTVCLQHTCPGCCRGRAS